MPNPQNRNDRRKGEERSETLIIPHITKEMLETARRMAEEGASRAEIEKAISAMQSPAQPASSPASRQAQHAAPAPQPMAAPPERKHRIIPTSRPRLSAEERAALRQQMQMRETQAETPQPEPEQEALRQEAARRAANRPAWFGRRQTAQNDSQEAARRAAQALAARLCEKGITNVSVYDVSNTHVSYLISEAFKYSHIVLASVTYNLGIYPVMHNYLMDMKALNLQNRTFALIENGSWACKSGDLMQKFINEELKNMTVLNERLSLASSLLPDKAAELDMLADAIAESVKAAK